MGILEENSRLEELDKKYIWHPFTQMKEWIEDKPIIIAEGRDCFLKDIYGRWYLDGVSSLWVNVYGHRKKEIDDAIKEQIDNIAHSTLLGLSNVPAIKLAERLVELVQKSLDNNQQSNLLLPPHPPLTKGGTKGGEINPPLPPFSKGGSDGFEKEGSGGDINSSLVTRHSSLVKNFPIKIDRNIFKITCVSMGNPHAVSFLDQPVADYPLAEIGPQVEHHAMFPNRVNFEIVNVINRKKLRARVWERGAGETLSCGTGACAIAVACRLKKITDNPVDIILPGGTLTIDWSGNGEVLLSGPSEIVFKGEWLD